MFKSIAIYNNEIFNASLPNKSEVTIFTNEKRDDFQSIGKGISQKKVNISELEEYYRERFFIYFRGKKTELLKLIQNKNILVLTIADENLAKELRFYKSTYGEIQWIKNINFSDIEKLEIEHYDCLTKEKNILEFYSDYEDVLKTALTIPKKEDNNNEENNQ